MIIHDFTSAERLQKLRAQKLVSVTCPGGTIHIEEIADSNSASCVGASGPALALCVRQ
jgi:hypothetical protein